MPHLPQKNLVSRDLFFCFPSTGFWGNETTYLLKQVQCPVFFSFFLGGVGVAKTLHT